MSTTMTEITTSVKIPPSNNNIFPRTPVENNDTTGSGGGSPIIRSTSKLGMFSVVSSRDSPVLLQRATSMDYLASPSHSADGNLNNIPSTPNLENSPSSSPRPLRSAMSSRTLHESLHRGLSSNDTFSKSENNLLKRNVSFTQVKIREYERIRGVNSDVYGPPLSIGWRYNTPTELDVSDYEKAKGEPRSSAEYLVPKKVRERIIKEHTIDNGKGDSKAKEMLGYWDQPGHIPRNQRRHSISFGTNPNAQQFNNDKKKKSKGMKHKLAKIIKENNPLTKIPPYKQQEDQLWNNAHQIAIEKAKRLEESIINGDKQTLDVRDLYSVGTPLNNVMPSRRNSVPVVTLLPSLLVGDGDMGESSVEKRRCSAPAAVVVQQQQHLSAPQSRISGATDEEEQVGLSLSISGHTETEPISGEGKKNKKIVATEEEDGEGNDTDDDVRLAQLLYEDAVISDGDPHPPAA